jgi:hypothetical protein
MALIDQEVAHAAGSFDECRCRLHVADIASRQHQDIGAAGNVGERVDSFDGLQDRLGRPATARATDRLDLAPPFPPNAGRCALMQPLSIAVLFVTTPASTNASSSLSQKPRRDRRLNRLQIVVDGP